MNTLTASPTHVVYLDRRTAERMLIGADTRAHFSRSAERSRRIASYGNYLRRSLGVRGERIELRGPLSWFRDLIESCGDTQGAFEIGRQLQGE